MKFIKRTLQVLELKLMLSKKKKGRPWVLLSHPARDVPLIPQDPQGTTAGVPKDRVPQDGAWPLRSGGALTSRSGNPPWGGGPEFVGGQSLQGRGGEGRPLSGNVH